MLHEDTGYVVSPKIMSSGSTDRTTCQWELLPALGPLGPTTSLAPVGVFITFTLNKCWCVYVELYISSSVLLSSPLAAVTPRLIPPCTWAPVWHVSWASQTWHEKNLSLDSSTRTAVHLQYHSCGCWGQKPRCLSWFLSPPPTSSPSEGISWHPSF